MFARRLLLVASMLSAAALTACGNNPTAPDAHSTMQTDVSARKDQMPWH